MMDDLRYRTLPIAVFLFQLFGSVDGFSCLSSYKIGTHPNANGWALASSSTPNEFSRPLNTDRILKTPSGNQRRTYREYQTNIEATPEECLALAQRFELCQLSSLQADLSVSLPPYLNAATTTSNTYLTVQVEGSILANITQTCVRTNEDFDMTVEFPIAAIVKPIAFNNNFAWKDTGDDNDDDVFSEKKKTKSKTSSSRNDRSRTKVLDMADLQQMMQEETAASSNSPRQSSSSSKKNTIRKNDYKDNTNNDDDDLYNYFGTEEIVEDEAIYSSSNGILDIGELVAQTFYLNLERYPKKPGTGPLEYTISG